MADTTNDVIYGQPESLKAAAQVEALLNFLLALPELRSVKVNLAHSALLSTYMTMAVTAKVDTAAAEQMVKAGLAYLHRKEGCAADAELPAKDTEKLRIAEAIGFVVAGEEHSLALDALMLTYRTVAKKHPCCITESARVASATADNLRLFAAEPGGARVH